MWFVDNDEEEGLLRVYVGGWFLLGLVCGVIFTLAAQTWLHHHVGRIVLA